MNDDGCKHTLMSEDKETAGWPIGKASGSYPEDTGSNPFPATNEGTTGNSGGERPDPVVPILGGSRAGKTDYSKRRPWLNAEEELLKRYYCVPFKMSIPWIAQVLKRSEKSVQKKILRMRLRRVGLKNRGLKEWLRQGGSLELPESVVGVTNITEADRRDAAKLEKELRKMARVEREIKRMME